MRTLKKTITATAALSAAMLLLTGCSGNAQPTDDGGMEFSFPAQVKEDGQIAWLGTVELSMMKSGPITRTSSDAVEFVRNTGGNWIAD